MSESRVPAAVYIPRIARYTHTAAFQEVADSLVWSLSQLGYSAYLAVELPRINILTIVLGWHLLGHLNQRPMPNSILYNLEQLKADDAGGGPSTSALRMLNAWYRVWDYSIANIDSLAVAGVEHVPLIPVAFTPNLVRVPRAAEQDIDVLQYGSLGARRQKIIEQLMEHGLKVVHAFDCYGAERDALIARAKVVLNMHYEHNRIFEEVRVSYLLANSKAVVAQVEPDTVIDHLYNRCVMGCPYDLLVDMCRELVANQHMRRYLEETGYRVYSRTSPLPALAAALGVGEPQRTTAHG